ncbi:MAG: hypothetical protein V1776_05320 [Candidatus Diapherotrites archaeon]
MLDSYVRGRLLKTSTGDDDFDEYDIRRFISGPSSTYDRKVKREQYLEAVRKAFAENPKRAEEIRRAILDAHDRGKPVTINRGKPPNRFVTLRRAIKRRYRGK